MKIGIHYRENTFSSSVFSFNKRWINFCKENRIDYKLVDATQNNIIEQLADCDAFMWHFFHNSPQDFLYAKQLLYSIEAMGKLVFPSFNISWHFDDKVGQKYLLEGIGAPLVESNVFYCKRDALHWLEQAEFPLVFKLRGGAGSQNVKLLQTKREAKKHIKRAFGKGFSQYNALGILKDRIQKFTKGNDTLKGILHGIARLAYPTEYEKVRGKDRGYIYFQKFIPNNDSDTRVIVIGNRAFAVKRMTRDGDFRASGSGTKKYEKEEIDIRTIKIAFEVSKKLNFDCIGFDFVFDEKNEPLIIEIGYGFAIHFYDPCPGYWDDELNWHEGFFIPQEWMIEDLILKIN